MKKIFFLWSLGAVALMSQPSRKMFGLNQVLPPLEGAPNHRPLSLGQNIKNFKNSIFKNPWTKRLSGITAIALFSWGAVLLIKAIKNKYRNNKYFAKIYSRPINTNFVHKCIENLPFLDCWNSLSISPPVDKVLRSAMPYTQFGPLYRNLCGAAEEVAKALQRQFYRPNKPFNLGQWGKFFHSFEALTQYTNRECAEVAKEFAKTEKNGVLYMPQFPSLHQVFKNLNLPPDFIALLSHPDEFLHSPKNPEGAKSLQELEKEINHFFLKINDTSLGEIKLNIKILQNFLIESANIVQKYRGCEEGAIEEKQRYLNTLHNYLSAFYKKPWVIIPRDKGVFWEEVCQKCINFFQDIVSLLPLTPEEEHRRPSFKKTAALHFLNNPCKQFYMPNAYAPLSSFSPAKLAQPFAVQKPHNEPLKGGHQALQQCKKVAQAPEGPIHTHALSAKKDLQNHLLNKNTSQKKHLSAKIQ